MALSRGEAIYAVLEAERDVIREAKNWLDSHSTLEALGRAVERLREAEDKLAALKGGK